MRRRKIRLLLPVLVIHVHGCYIKTRVGYVMQVIVCIFAVEQKTVNRGKSFAERALHKEIIIPLPVGMLEHARLLAHRRARIAALRTVVVRLCPPFAVLKRAEQRRLRPPHGHVAISPHFGGVVAVFLRIAELVFSRRI